MPDDENDLDDLDDEMMERVERIIAKREKDKEREAALKKPPKDFGEAANRIADLVLDKLDARAEARRKEREEADEEPTRGEGTGGGFLKMLGG